MAIQGKSQFALAALLLILLLTVLAHTRPASAQSCDFSKEPTLRQRALQSADPNVSEEYLACFNYSDAAPGIRKHLQKLNEDTLCEQALRSNDPAFLRRSIIDLSHSECAVKLAKRLKAVDSSRNYVRYRNSILKGNILGMGNVDSEVDCARACNEYGDRCKGYSFQADKRICVAWDSITSRVPYGGAVSGALADVQVDRGTRTPAPSPPPAQGNQIFKIFPSNDLPGGDYLVSIRRRPPVVLFDFVADLGPWNSTN